MEKSNFELLKQNQSFADSLKSGSEKRTYTPYPEIRVHRAGLFWLTISNCGQLGNFFLNMPDVCTERLASSAEMPGGSKIEYLCLTSMEFGGYLESYDITIGATTAKKFDGPLVSTALEGNYSVAQEMLPYQFEEEPSGLTMGRIYETSNTGGRMNCLLEDVYDPKATAYEQFTTRFTDKGTDLNTFDTFDNRDHIPLGIEVKQTSYAWPYDYAKKIIIIDYTVYNRNPDKKDIYNFFIGLYMDSDVNNKNVRNYGFLDDLCGFIDKWSGYIDPATGERKTVDMNMVWSADNDGREHLTDPETFSIIEPEAGNILDGATGIFTIRVLRNPNPNLKYSFNLWNAGWTDESLDWGPRWQTGLHSDWQFDLTPMQKGYDDTNYDMFSWFGSTPMYGGRTEGVPAGDSGRYMSLSNDEFDYNQTSIREIYLGMSTQADGTPIPQAEKWQRYTTPEKLGQPGFSSDIVDGTPDELNNIANGSDQRFQLSFGPLGNESYTNVAVDKDLDNIPDSVITNKKVWKFAYGDSLKLTLAFMVSENFHTSLEQDPNYYDSTGVNLSDGLDVTLYDQGWYDAFYNVVWAERVYDTPLFDTPVKRWGETKKDGWYGEDVGADGMFGDVMNDTFCWWLGAEYPGSDTGEGDFEMTAFTVPITDYYGNPASNEDELLRYGRQHVEKDYGITGNLTDGEGYGYMVKYDKLDGPIPQGSWIRYGFDNGRLDAGDGVPDFSGPPPPPPPKIKVSVLDNDITVEWTSHEFYKKDDGSIGAAGPEFTYDPFTRLHDFEGYHIELSPDRQLKNFTTIFSVDKMNFAYQNVAVPGDYYSNPIPADSIYLFPDNYPQFITSGINMYRLAKFGDNRDFTQDHSAGNDMTFTCTTEPSPYPGWNEIRNYKFVLHNQTIAQHKFIAVTAADYGAPKMDVPAIKSSPESNAEATVTSTLTTTKDVIVVPNPYRDDADYGGMGWEVLDGKYTYDEEYRKLVFLNIPERCVIRIFTLAGDLVKVITHNGYSEWNVPYWYGLNGAYWNLISDNNQAVVSGIYLFSVQDVDKKKDDFIGKFVIIK